MSAQPLSASASAPAARSTQALSFAFCKRHGVLIQKVGDQFAEAVYRVGAQPAAIHEVRRVLGMPPTICIATLDPPSYCVRSS